MTKVLVLIHALEKGGAEKLLVSALPLFKQKNIQVELLLLNALKSVPEFLQTIKDADIPIHDFEINNIYSVATAIKLNQFLRKNKFDILHVHLFPSLYWASLAIIFLKNPPLLVYTEHSNYNKRRNKRYLKGIEIVAYGKYSKIIAITESVKSNLVKWIGQESKILTILNGVDITTIQATPKIDREQILTELGIPKGAKLMFMAASFRYPKDQITIVRACKILGENYHLLLAGEGDLQEDVLTTAKDLSISNQIHLLGFRTDAASLMKSVDLNILSSDYEGMSGVTLEALASGVPFIGSNVAGIKEIVPDNSFLFNKGDAVDLSKKIVQLFHQTHLYSTMIRDGLLFVKQYDIEVMVSNYSKLYMSLLGNKISNSGN